MSHSLNEIEALIKRAARGTGMSWGMAEEAARATRWLAAHDLAGPELLARILTQNDGVPHENVAPGGLDGTWRAPSGNMCPLIAGATLNDCADRLAEGQPVEMTHISCPLLILPFAAWASIHIQRPVRVAWLEAKIDTDGERLWIDDPIAQINIAKTATLTCRSTSERVDAAKRPGQRGRLAPEIWAQLNTFAQRTYAPATESSRLLGAGSGVSDND